MERMNALAVWCLIGFAVIALFSCSKLGTWLFQVGTDSSLS
jgi:hypothetical protein